MAHFVAHNLCGFKVNRPHYYAIAILISVFLFDLHICNVAHIWCSTTLSFEYSKSAAHYVHTPMHTYAHHIPKVSRSLSHLAVKLHCNKAMSQLLIRTNTYVWRLEIYRTGPRLACVCLCVSVYLTFENEFLATYLECAVSPIFL